MATNFTILSNTELSEKINELITKSNNPEVKSFFRSSLGTFYLDVIVSSYETNNYAILTSINELFFDSVVEYSNAIRLANNLGYHVKRKRPAKIYYDVVFDDTSTFDNVSRIKFKAQEFNINKNSQSLYQRYDFDYFVSTRLGDGDNYLVQGNLTTTYFSLAEFIKYNTLEIENENISNYIGGDSLLDMSVYSSYFQETYSVFRDSIDESDIENPYICFAETQFNKNIKLIFGNDSIGKIPFGQLAVTYFETTGDAANNTIVKGEEFESLSYDGIEIYDLNGNIINNNTPYVNAMKLVFSSTIDDGYDFETIEEININSRKFASINNTLNSPDDYEFFLKNTYNLDDVKVWGSGSEINFRKEIDYSNLVLFSSNKISYDDVIADSNNVILYNLYSNICWVESIDSNSNLKNGVGTIFEVVTKCDDDVNAQTKSGLPCISLGTLYLLGKFSPITLFYNNIMDKYYDTEVSRIVEDMNSKATIGMYTGFLAQYNIKIDVTAKYTTLSSKKSKYEIEDNVITNFNNLTDRTVSSLINVINNEGETTINFDDLNVANIYKTIEVSYVENTFLEFLEANLTDTNLINSMNVMSKKLFPNVLYNGNLTDNPIKCTRMIQEGSYFADKMLDLYGTDYTTSKLILNYYIKKSLYNVYEIVRLKKWELLDVEYFDIILSNFSLGVKV